uniref:Uncharacterized protein n=2 Tax=Triticum urartu TaxID=4572 RepID=A0A8R7TDB2_TRIUA
RAVRTRVARTAELSSARAAWTAAPSTRRQDTAHAGAPRCSKIHPVSQWLIIDEADRKLVPNFEEDMKQIFKCLPRALCSKCLLSIFFIEPKSIAWCSFRLFLLSNTNL